MANKIFILLLLLTFLSGQAEAEQNILAVQSVPVGPYEEAVRGFEHVYGTDVKRLFISGRKEKDVLKTINEIRPDMVLAVGRDALLIARRITTIPVIYCMVLNPQSILAGEKNIGGVSMNLPPEKQLHELLTILPSTHSIGLLYDPGQTGVFVQKSRAAAAKINVNLMERTVRLSRDVASLINTMKGKIGVFWMLPDTTVITPETVESILLFSLENNIPVLTYSEKYLELGAMISIGIDPFDIGSQAGELAQKLFSESDSKEVQHVDARKALISINYKIARKLGIHIDEKAIINGRLIR